jgi:hypothetical protein
VSIAKNYLQENEIGDLNLLVSAFLDLAEFQARRKQIMNMSDWLERTKKFLESNNLSSIIKIGFRPLRNNELLITFLKMYRDTLRKGCEVNRCLSAE